jgi:DNA-binding protein HU-beta
MNKSQLVDALTDRLGDRKTAATAVDALLQIVVDTVRSGDSVSLAGFGVFESRARAARTGRNPRTGETVAVPATTVPAFRPGTGFRSAVAGDAAGTVEAAAPAEVADAPPRRRRSSRAVTTNGSGDGAALNGAVDLGSVPTTTLLADQPATPVDDQPAPAKKAAAKKGAAKKGAAKKPDAKAANSAPKSDAKKGKKSKKGK